MRRILAAAGLIVGLCMWGSPAQAATDWDQVSASGSHTCAIRAGKLYCWGSNNDGQLGTGNNTDYDKPKQITTATDWKQVSAGEDYTCAARGKLYCWGSNGSAQLGTGNTTDYNKPKQITAATDWTSVSAGQRHTCATRGKLYCWGQNAYGQLGNGTSSVENVRSTPQQITTATDWKQVSVGYFHTCAVRGKLYCWGNNDLAQVGNGQSNDNGFDSEHPESSLKVVAPKQITTATDWTMISAGAAHSCAIRSVGKLYCWGLNAFGQVGDGLGDGEFENTSTFAGAVLRLTPKQITTATDWKDVGAGVTHTCAVRGKLYCWGYNNDGQVGDGNAGEGAFRALPKQITTATDWKRADGGRVHSCAVRGKLYCWGENGGGLLGDGTDDTHLTPKNVG